ncbi:MAG: methyltransferase [Gloeotrichia echinulata HAB0833]
MTSKILSRTQKTYSSIKLPSWLEFQFGTWIAKKLTQFVESQTPPDLRLIDMSTTYEQARCLYVVAKLKLADCLVDGSRDIESLADELNVQSAPLDRILRYLHELGIFGLDSAGRYHLNKVSEFLISDHPQSMRAIIILNNEEAYTAWGNLLHTVKTGQNTFIHTYQMPFYEYHKTHIESADIFDRAMTSVSIVPDQAVAEDYDFSIYRTLSDIGGGRGSLLRQILQRHTSIQGILFDSASVLTDEVRQQWRHDPLSKRVKLQIGDFFKSVPEDIDAYLLKGVIHNWPDDKVVQIYKTIHQAMKPKARLLLAEMVIVDNNPLQRIKLNLDVNMMVIHSGQERTAAQHCLLLKESGFKITKIVPTRSLYSVIEAQPVL